MAMTWYICEKNDSCVDCPIIYREEEPCCHMVEVEAVIHAEWVKDKNGLYSCSHCDTVCPYDVQGDVIEYWDCPRCPKCGAIMNI